ncbi:unnamed protein product [Microthlaspi erraticum]|uniref:Arabidopsis retrotransposon Orf1 C-terminal domain-containing protein n=1 Tax=Microthlaspi erraticum TaxID=1685480 RepID=A0A6D2I2J4_9BRAS|nr:unnamed protein product [Microthlaspi erraticum]
MEREPLGIKEMSSKGFGLQSLMGYSSSRSKAAQIRSPVLRYVHKALANTFFARKALGQSMRENWSPFGQEKVYSSRWMDIKFCKTNLFIEHKELDGRFQFKFTHPLAGPPSFFCPTLSSPRSRRYNIDFRPPVYT